jgi:hypothetical protein
LSRTPILCLNNNKSIGVFDNLDADLVDNKKADFQALPKLLSNNAPANKQLTDNHHTNSINTLLDQILNSNMKRSLDMQFKLMMINSKCLTLEWLTEQSNTEYFSNKDDLNLAWIFYARHVYNQSTQSQNQIEKLLNILSNCLELDPKCELMWLVYLKCYLEKRNALSDYHEISMLCMDNLVTYDLVWFIIATCPIQYIDLIFERYEKHLIELENDSLLEFEQAGEEEIQETCSKRVSFYLMEMILYHVYIKMATQTVSLEEGKEEAEEKFLVARQTFKEYLIKQEIVSKLEPADLSVLWLSYIHLEAFLYLPNWLNISNHAYLIDHNNGDRNFWRLNNQKRVFNRTFFKNLSILYQNRHKTFNLENNLVTVRNYDLFLLPWKQQNPLAASEKQANMLACSMEKLQSLFHEGLKSINSRCSSYSKQEIRLFSLPIFLNMIHLSLMNGKIEIGTKLCERLLKDASGFKEIWFSLINLQLVANSNGSSAELIEKSIENFLSMSSTDAHAIYTVAQIYLLKVSYGIDWLALFFFMLSINFCLKENSSRSVEIIENFIKKTYNTYYQNDCIDTDLMFK